MHLSELVVVLLLIVAVFCVWYKTSGSYQKEGLSGFGIASGLNFNNNAKHCFKNIYDPPDYPGYCETIGKVVV